MIKYEVNVYDSGAQEWYFKSQRHREDGPAIIGTNGTKAWWINGKRHREDGPAVEYRSGSEEWWLNGKKVTKADVMGYKVTIDGKEVTLSAESYKALKESIND